MTDNIGERLASLEATNRWQVGALERIEKRLDEFQAGCRSRHTDIDREISEIKTTVSTGWKTIGAIISALTAFFTAWQVWK